MKIGILCFFILGMVGCRDCCSYKADLYGEANAKVYTTEARGRGKNIGEVRFRDVEGGMMVDVELTNLMEGEHGFHIHEFGDCRATFHRGGKIVLAGRAGGHFDPYETNKHLGPNADGHLGDLQKLNVGKNGEVIDRFFVRGVKVDMIKNKSVVVHEGGDNYKDEPVVLGGGGNRVACGVIK